MRVLAKTSVLLAACVAVTGLGGGVAGADSGSRAVESHDEFTVAIRGLLEAIAAGDVQDVQRRVCPARRDEFNEPDPQRMRDEAARENGPVQFVGSGPADIRGDVAIVPQFVVFQYWAGAMVVAYERDANGQWLLCGYDDVAQVPLR